MTRFTLEQLQKCAAREVAQRKRVYRRLVGEGKMSPEMAEREIAMMEAIEEYFERLTQPELL